MIKPRFFIEKRSRLPIFRINPALDNYFFPFFPAAGIAAKELNNELTYNSVQWEKVFTGQDSMVFKWLGAEAPLSAYDLSAQKTVTNPDLFTEKLVFKRNIKIGDFYIGKILNQSQSVFFVKKNVFLNQNIKSTVTAYFRDGLVWDQQNLQVRQENLYLFWRIPEVSTTDIFYISNCQIFLTMSGKYLCHIITFCSVGDQLNRIGKFLDQRIQFSSPGESPVLPVVRPALIWKSEIPPTGKDLLFFDEFKKNSKNEYVFLKKSNSKQVYIDKYLFENSKGVKSIQFEFEGVVGLGGLELYGYKKNIDNMIVNRSSKIFTHQNIPVEVSPLQKTRQYNDEWIILGNWKAMLRFWFTDFRGDAGLFFNPKATRDEQGVLEHVSKTWDEVLTPEILQSVYPAQQNSRQNVDLVGLQNMALNPFTRLFFEKLKFDTSSKEILPRNVTNMNLNLSEFLNINQFLNDPIQILEFGAYQLKNNKKMISSIMGDVSKFLGIGVPLFSSAGREMRTGLSALNQIGNTTMSWLPDEVFTNKNIIKISSSFNFAISKQFLIFLKASLPSYSNGLVSPAYIPFDVFKETKWNPWANIIGTHNLNQSVHFELTDSLEILNKKNVLSKSTTEELRQGVKSIPSNKFFTFATPEDFVIQMLSFKVIGFRNCVITFRDRNKKLINYYKTATQNKFSGNAKDITTTIWFDWSRDNNISLDKKFRNNFSSLTELIQYNQNKLVAAKNTADFEKIILESVTNNFNFPNATAEVRSGLNLASGTEHSFTFSPIILKIKNIFQNLPENKDFWTIWKNPLNKKKRVLLEKIFSKITFSLKWNLRRIPAGWKPWKMPDIWRFKDVDRVLRKFSTPKIIWSGSAVVGDHTTSRTTLFFSTSGEKMYDRYQAPYLPEVFVLEPKNTNSEFKLWWNNVLESQTGYNQEIVSLDKREQIYEKRSIRTEIWSKRSKYVRTFSTETYFSLRNNYYAFARGWNEIKSEYNANLKLDESAEELRIEFDFRNVKLKFEKSLLDDFESVKTELWPEITNIKISNEL